MRPWLRLQRAAFELVRADELRRIERGEVLPTSTPAGMPESVTKALVLAPTIHQAWHTIRHMFPEDAFRLRETWKEDHPEPKLDGFVYRIAVPPPEERLRAWDKVRETERRLALASWAMGRSDPVTGEHGALTEDLVGAYFYAFEAAVQILKEEIGAPFEAWLQAHKRNTLTFRAVRTIRTLAVHVEDIRPGSRVAINVVKGRGGRIYRAWTLPDLRADALRRLKRPKVREAEIDAWSKLRNSGAPYLMKAALRDLREIVADAESLAQRRSDEDAGG